MSYFLSVDLDDNIRERLTEIGTNIGLSIDELARYILGAYAAGELVPTPHFGHLTDIKTDPVANEMSLLVKGMLRSFEASGAVKCPICTQPITLKDLGSGTCPRCQSQIDTAS